MPPTFKIITEGLEPELEWLPVNEPSYDFAPQSEYLRDLTPGQRSLYQELQKLNWTDELSYRYLTELDISSGFYAEWLRHNHWPEEKIQQWLEACQNTTRVPNIEQGLDQAELDYAIQINLVEEVPRRRKLAEEMEKNL